MEEKNSVQKERKQRVVGGEAARLVLISTGMQRRAIASDAKITQGHQSHVTRTCHRLARTHTTDGAAQVHSPCIDLRWATEALLKSGRGILPADGALREGLWSSQEQPSREREQQSSLAWCWNRRGSKNKIAFSTWQRSEESVAWIGFLKMTLELQVPPISFSDRERSSVHLLGRVSARAERTLGWTLLGFVLAPCRGDQRMSK